MAPLLVMAVAPDMRRVAAAVREGADLVEVCDAAVAAAARQAYPGLVIAARTGREAAAREACAAGADLVAGDVLATVAVSCGVGLVGSLDVVTRAVAAGVAADRVLVEGADPLPVDTRWPVLVSLLGRSDADLARAAVFGWLGVGVFRVERVRETRRALRMVSAIRGDVPPARAVRGLA